MKASCIGFAAGLLPVILSLAFCSLILGRGSVLSKVRPNATKCTFLAAIVDITVLTACILVSCMFHCVITSSGVGDENYWRAEERGVLGKKLLTSRINEPPEEPAYPRG